MTNRLRARYLLGVIALVALSAVLLIVYRNYRAVMLEFEASPTHSEQTPTDNSPLRITLQTNTGTHIAAWYSPSKNRAAIIILHGSNSDHLSMTAEVSILALGGYGVLAIDWPGDGLSEGQVHWGKDERSALVAAIDWLSMRDDIDKDRVGAVGFSLGSYMLAQVAATDQRLRAIVLEATPPDYLEYTRWSHHRWGMISEFGATLGIWKSGIDVNEQRPADVVKQISPRKLLIIGGSDDPIVPEFMTRELYAAAQPPVSLWIVEGAQHGSYAEVSPEYSARITKFFDEALLR